MDTTEEHPSARSLDDLARSGGLAAVFRPGATAGEHHWELRSSGGELLAVTARVHNGGRVARTFWKLTTLTGMDAGNDIHVELRGAQDCVLARISSKNDAPATVTVSDGAGHTLASGVREKTLLLKVKDPDAVTLRDADDDALAQIDCPDDGPWPVRNRTGDLVGELLAGDPGMSLAPRWSDWIDPKWALSVGTYARTQHLGLRRVTRYVFVPARGSAGSPPVALALLPLIAGLIY